jgi:DNA modification methylase
MTAPKIVMPSQIVMRATASLVGYARNSRTHDERQIDVLCKSITEYGFTNPVLIDGNRGVIAGHGRIMAAEKLGLPEVPCIELRHLTNEQKRAYLILDNQSSLMSGWNEALLAQELADLSGVGFEATDLGFDAAEVDRLMETLGVDFGGRAEGDPDAIPEAPVVPTSKLGDVWLLGKHRVMCGDSTQLPEWQALMGDEKCDCVWTDPPYNVAYESKLAGSIQNDNMTNDAFYRFLFAFYTSVSAFMKPGAAIYVAHADTEGLNFRSAFTGAGFKLSGCLVWKKNALVLGRSDYQWIHEPILYGWKQGGGHKWYGGRKQVTVQELVDSPFEKLSDGRFAIRSGDTVLIVSGQAVVDELATSIIHHPKPTRSPDHPTMKPTSLIEKMLNNSAQAGNIIVDGFGGSGSTLIASERLHMQARLMEYDPKFVDVIVRRWQDFIGSTATLDGDGRTFAEITEARCA